jgi:GNAT superfamily N-acetyltransferase
MGQDEITIRPYRASDKPFVFRALVRYSSEGLRLDPLHRRRANKPVVLRYCRFLDRQSRKPDWVLLVALWKRTPVGFIVGLRSKLSGFGEKTIVKFRHPAEITELYVEHKFRGRGIGKELIREMEKRFRGMGCDWVSLTVADFNPAHKFYLLLGYKDRFIEMGRPL